MEHVCVPITPMIMMVWHHMTIYWPMHWGELTSTVTHSDLGGIGNTVTVLPLAKLLLGVCLHKNSCPCSETRAQIQGVSGQGEVKKKARYISEPSGGSCSCPPS